MSSRHDDLLVAIDIGGTKTAVAVAETASATAGSFVAQSQFATPPTARATLGWVVTAARQLLTERPALGVGVSFGGHVLPGPTPAVRSLHVPGWEDIDLVGELTLALYAPVCIANDAEAAGRAEYTQRPDPATHLDLAYITVSTGVGGALFFDGHAHRGRHGLAGEIGHIPVRDFGQCSCGGVGHLESVASGPAIARAAETALRQRPYETTELRHAQRTAGSLTARDVDDAARRGDALACDILGEAGSAIGEAVALIALLIDPDVVVVGGGVAQAGPAWWHPLRAAAARSTLRETQVRPAGLGTGSALRGALALAVDASTRRHVDPRTPSSV